MVDVAHHGDNRRSSYQRRIGIFFEEGLLGRRWRSFWCLVRLSFNGLWLRFGDIESEFGRDERCSLAIYPLVHGRENAASNQRVDDVRRVDP